MDDRPRTGAPVELELVLASLAEGLRVVTVALAPYMPAKTATLLDALASARQPARLRAAGWGGATPRSLRSSPRSA